MGLPGYWEGDTQGAAGSVAETAGGSFFQGLKSMIPPLSFSASSGPSQAGGMFDGSGWNVNFGGGSITSSAQKDQGLNWLPIAAGLIGLALLIRAWKG
jgi:hypothetical protein